MLVSSVLSISLFSLKNPRGAEGLNSIGACGEIVLSTRYGKTRVFVNKTLSTDTTYQQDLINRDLLSTRFDSW
jgi:hypothetical protein